MKKASTIAISIAGIFLLAQMETTSIAAQSPEPIQNPLERQIVAEERQGLDALKIGNLDAFGNLTADDAVFVDAHGSATKAQVMKNVAGFKLVDYSMDNLSFVPLSSKSGLISYKISEKGVSHGKEFTAQAYVSTIWAKRGGHWFCLFSQETAAR